ncbi:MAG: hypothetical protein QOH97_4812 [Actinoplanes sp.]|jgi:hypothetical protein|nr:hypothetical protein [Actinoplanes sp.]
MTTGTPKTRTLALAAVALLMALICACTAPVTRKTEPATEPFQVNTIITDIQDTIRKQADVLTADANYQNSLDAHAMGAITVTVKAGGDVDTVYDSAIEAFWRSKLTPLSTVTISVTDESGKASSRGTGVSLLDPSTKADLTAKYGPRPS